MAARRRPGRPVGHSQPEDETRVVIVRTAARLFGVRGYASVSIGEVAAAVGVTKPTLYYHFSGKDAIYAATVRWMLGEIGAGIAAIARAPGPIRDRLLTIARAGLEYSRPDANLDTMMRDVAAYLTPAQQAEVAVAHEGMLAAFDEVMLSGIARGELRPTAPRILTHAYLHLLDAFTVAPGAPIPDKHAAIETMVDLFLDGAIRRQALDDRPGKH